ncbi:MAG: hypothetical protein KDA49_04555 [Rhodospirillaceae bacterium]|nr:hypothetical protein [Rhodospirillaceae bacterium]MCA8931713.1 hypothetical protein [Rhodospirillaceae bacterium]
MSDLTRAIDEVPRRSLKATPFDVSISVQIAATLNEIHEILQDPLGIRTWWSSSILCAEPLSPAPRTHAGFVMKCFAKGFFPHAFQFRATVVTFERDRFVFETRGDFDGVMHIHAMEDGDRVTVTARWLVDVRHPFIQPLVRLRALRPLFRWNHRWSMRQGTLGLQDAVRRRRLNLPPAPCRQPTFPHNFRHLRVPSRWRC